jgi:hypothetical protein
MPRFIPFHFEGWTMGKYGVCTRTEPDTLLPGWDELILADLKTTDRIQAAALAAGYTRVWDGRDRRYSAPPKGGTS